MILSLIFNIFHALKTNRSNPLRSLADIQRLFNESVQQCPLIARKVFFLEKKKNPLNITLSMDQ